MGFMALGFSPIDNTEALNALKMVLIAGDDDKILKNRRRCNEKVPLGNQLPSFPKRTVDCRRLVDNLFGYWIDNARPASIEKGGDLALCIFGVKAPQNLVASDERKAKNPMFL